MSDRERMIEAGIDYINQFRAELRMVGMTACAQALDEAFAHCLREYAHRPKPVEAEQSKAKDDPDTNLN